MPDRQPPLFDEPKPQRKRPASRAPEALTPPQLRALEEWAEDVVPWLSREALESFESLRSYADEILEWWQADGGTKADWPRTIQNRIRTVERRRLSRLAAGGSASAREALRDPKAWRDAYDRRHAAVKAADVEDRGEDIAPTGGGTLHVLGRRRDHR